MARSLSLRILSLAGVLITLSVAGLLSSPWVQAQERGIGRYDVPPPGFEWHSCDVIECSFLVPEGWAFQRLQDSKLGGTVLQYRMVPKMDIGKTSPIVRINIIQKTKFTTGLSAQRHIDLFVRQLDREGEILDLWKNKSKLLRSTAVMSLNFSRLQRPVKKFNLLVHNDRTDTLYVLSFESKTDDWDKNWRMIEQIVTRLRLAENA